MKKMKLSSISKQLLVTPLIFVFGITPILGEVEKFQLPTKEQITFLELISGDREIYNYYKHTNFEPIWIGNDSIHQKRLSALKNAIVLLPTHGLSSEMIHLNDLWKESVDNTSTSTVLELELQFTNLLFEYAKIINGGVIEPGIITEKIDRRRPKLLANGLILEQFVSRDPEKYLASLAPQTLEYAVLRKELALLDHIIGQGRWGEQIEANDLSFGDEGIEVLKLKQRLSLMGYMPKSVSKDFDISLATAIRRFQHKHGLPSTGIATPETIKAINTPPEIRRKSVVVGLERTRWMNKPLGEKHIIVNIPEFKARYYDSGQVKFETSVVVGKSKENLQTPEFSRNMEFIVVNPIWNIPYSIITEEIFPSIRQDITSEESILFYDGDGNPVERSQLSLKGPFRQSSFPYTAKQMPGAKNPLGRVKFMFPNRHSIYLHDSPERSLFGRSVRAFSHGCIRLEKPMEFARLLLGKEGHDFDELYSVAEGTTNEIEIFLKERIPVHITYQTAWVDENGEINYRSDIYDRDTIIFAAMENSTNSLPTVKEVKISLMEISNLQ